MAQYLTYNDETLSIGDTIRVHQEIAEGNKSRIQIFEGILMAIAGKENGKSLTVRKIGANNVGVEKIFPVNLPAIKKIEVKRRGQVRRSKLYFLRDKVGKSATKIKEKDTNAKTKSAA